MELLHFSGNIGLALLLGVFIGLEREITNHQAGLRTNALVAVGAALFASLTALVPEPSSPTRVAANIVVGVGFLGGGVILKEGINIRGLTTAAGVWCSAAVGTLAGFGFAIHALLGTFCVLVVLVGFHPLDWWLDRLRRRYPHFTIDYRVRITCREHQFRTVRDGLLQQLRAIPGVRITGTSSKKQRAGRAVLTADLTIPQANAPAVRELLDQLMTDPGVVGVDYKQHPAS